MPSPWDHDVIASTPKPVTKSPFGGATWMGNAAYPLVKPDHADELEQNAAINEFGSKMPRAKAEAQAYDSYKKRQHTEAAAHHLAGMKAAHGAGDIEAARKHSLMYNLHSKAIGHEPVGPAHPDVVAHLAAKPSRVYKFKPHHGDQLALSPQDASSSSPVASSASPSGLGKNERDALYVLWRGSQALLKGGVFANAKLSKARDYRHLTRQQYQGRLDRGAESVPVSYRAGPVGKDYSHHLSEGMRQRGYTLHGDGNSIRLSRNKQKIAHLVKLPGGEEKVHGNVSETAAGHMKSAFQEHLGADTKKPEPTEKGELPASKPKGAKPCICSSYSFPHRHKSGRCGVGK